MENPVAHLNYTGLKQEEVIQLGIQYGKNEFKADRKGGFLKMALDIAKEPMFIMLLVACLLYFLLGEFKEGMLMMAAMVFVGAISFYQEIKSSNALAALKQYTQPKIPVIRDGIEQVILSSYLVPGDLMIISEGNLIPADALIIKANDLSLNESIITGESLPVTKNTSDELNQLFQGTTINSGTCYATVTAIGNATVLGKLGKSLSTITASKTLLQKQIGNFVKIMAIIGFLIFCLIWGVNFLHTQNGIQSLLIGLTLAMAIIPEEIPVAFSSFMALGAFHMAKLGIITRQPLTIENLGAVSVVCLDKTGTITENKMVVKTIYSFDIDLLEEVKAGGNPAIQEVLNYARLASEETPFDAMEKAIVEAFDLFLDSKDPIPKMIHEYPLGGQPPMMTHVYPGSDTLRMIAGKGAPERIFQVCKLADAVILKMSSIITGMASRGYRVLGICSARFTGDLYPEKQDDFDWQFRGLLALYDPPKKGVKGEFDKWHQAGIQIKLVTGDFKETALNIATQVGLEPGAKLITGDELMHMTEGELQFTISASNIFTRMFPEAKLKLIETFKRQDQIVAMMGDGVNDGPALRSAQIGIAMGGKGTEIAREAASLILTDDDLGKVTEAIRQGRKIYHNLKKAVRYIISIHVPIIITASVPLLLNWKLPNIFTPIHVIFLELIMGPTCSVFFENEPVESGIMNKAPRSRSSSIFTWKELMVSLLQGLVIASGILILYHFFMQRDYSISYVRTIVFITLIVSNVFLTFVNRSFDENIFKTIQYKNNLTRYILIASAIFLGCIAFIPFVRDLFQLSLLSPIHYGVCLITAMIITLWFEVYKSYPVFSKFH